MRFQNPKNGYIEEFGEATWLWALVGGPFYLAYKQIWLHAIIAGAASLMTAGLSWIAIYPLIIKWVLRTHYAKIGWIEINEGQSSVSSPSGAKSNDVRILTIRPESGYREVQEISVKLVRRSPLERKFTREDANQRLQEKAIALGANAIIDIQYDQKDHTATTAGYIEAKGIAIIDESDVATCPFCAETIKKAATRCKHCGSDILNPSNS